MKDGFLRVAAATSKIKVADPVYNGNEIIKLMEEGEKRGAKIMVFPELCLTGYTCGDLFLQDTLLESARNEYAGVCGTSFRKGRKALQCGGRYSERAGSGLHHKDEYSELCGIL